MSHRPPNDARPSATAEPSPPGPAQGVRRADDGRRQAFASIEFARSLHFSALEIFGDETQDVLYRAGYEWGLQDMTGLNQRLREEFGGDSDLWQMDTKFVLNSWWQPLADAGWGAWTLAFAAHVRGVTVIDVRNSFVASALHGADHPVCHLYAGLFAGAFSFFDRAERHAVEIRCQALGDAVCTFVIGPGTDIDAIETWRQQGVTADVIVRRLR